MLLFFFLLLLFCGDGRERKGLSGEMVCEWGRGGGAIPNVPFLTSFSFLSKILGRPHSIIFSDVIAVRPSDACFDREGATVLLCVCACD